MVAGNRICIQATGLAAVLLANTALTALHAQTVDIPLQIITLGTGNYAYDRLIINVGVAGGTPHPYLFDTGSALFNVPQAFVPTTLGVLATGASYTYADGNGYYGNLSLVPSISFYGANAATPTVTLQTTTNGFVVNEVTKHLLGADPGGASTISIPDPLNSNRSTTYYVDPHYPNGVGGVPPIESAIYGTFGAGDFATVISNGMLPGTSTYTPVTVGSILGQSTGSGYVVAANATQTTQTATNCSPCVMLGLTPQMRAQFTSFSSWITTGSSFPNAGVNGATTGANASTEFGVNFLYTATLNGITTSWYGPSLLDSGTQDINLHTSADVSALETQVAGYLNAGAIVTMTSSVPGSATTVFRAQSAATAPDTYQVNVTSNFNTIVPGQNQTLGIAWFLANSTEYDLANKTIGYSANFVTDATIARAFTINASDGPLGLAGVIADGAVPTTLTLNAGASATLTNTNTYTGATTIAPGAQLVVAGPGSISSSALVTDNGTLDLSGVVVSQLPRPGPTSVTLSGLAGMGRVDLGSQALTLTSAASNFAGVIADGGSYGGTGASLTVGAGTQTLSGVNTYTGSTTVTAGATLALSGAGSVAASSGLLVGGVFDISQTSGATVTSLTGAGRLSLGAQALTLAAPAGLFSGVLADGGVGGGTGGQLVITSGTQTLSGTNTYTGSTTIAPGATLALGGLGSITNSTAVVGGTLDVSQGTAAAVGSLAGAGRVNLGTQTLTLANAGTGFSGQIVGPGNLSVAGGTQTLSGANAYTGTTTVNAGGTLALSGSGSIAASSGVVNNGVLDVSQTAGTSLAGLTGTGQTLLGAQALTLSAAGGVFTGILADGGIAGGRGGSLAVTSGTQTLGGVNAYTGATTIAPGATLALIGAGTIAASAVANVGGVLDVSQARSATITSLSGTGRVNLGGQTLTVANASSTFGGVLADGGITGGTGGGLSLAAGTLGLGSRNTYTGATTIAAGATLALSGSGSIAASSGLANAGVFDITATQGAAITSLSGGGRVNLGAQTLTLTNASGSFAGSLSDAGLGGQLVVAGGTQSLTGANSYTGGTTVTGGGTVAVTSDAALGASGSGLTLNNGTLLALGALASNRSLSVAAGGGTVNANGFQVSLGGSLTLTGALTTLGAVQLSGATVTNAPLTVGTGLLSVNGTLGGPGLIVQPGATLRGIGVISAPTTVSGRLAPGNSPGTLTFNAPVTLNAGSATQLDIDGTGTGTGAGNYSRIIVNGSNSFTAAGTLVPTLRGITGSATNGYTPPLGQSFNAISAGGGVLGSYAGLAEPPRLAAGTRFDALYGPNALTLVVTPASYGNLAASGLPQTPNQAAVGAALDSTRPAAGVRLNLAQSQLYTPLYAASPAALPVTLDQLSPAIDGERLMIARDDWYLASGAVLTEMEARRGALRASGSQAATNANGVTVWLAGLGQFANVASSLAPGYHSATGGVVVGADAPVLPWLTAGLALGYVGTDASDGAGARLNGDGLQVQAYGSLHQGIAFLDMQAGGNFWEGTTWRTASIYGGQTRGDDSGTAAGALVRAGVHLPVGPWQVEPSFTLGGVSLHQNGLTENQGGAVALSLASNSIASVQTVLGARIQRSFALGGLMTLVPSVKLGWVHELADTNASATASFAGTGGTPFTVQTASIGRNSALAGFDATLQTGGPVSVFAGYTGSLDGRRTAQNLTGGLRLTW